MRARLRWGRFNPLPPGAPTITSTSGGTSGSPIVANVTVNWSAPANTGGELTGYLVWVGTETPVSVGPSTNTYTFTGLSFTTFACNYYIASVKAVNTAGESAAASESITVPQTTEPTIYNVTKTPNEGAPGVSYGVSWFKPCASGYWNQYEVQDRLYWNGAEVVVSGDEDGWEAFYSGSNTSHTVEISTASSNQQYQFRVRAKYVSGGTVVSTSGWSAVQTS